MMEKCKLPLDILLKSNQPKRDYAPLVKGFSQLEVPGAAFSPNESYLSEAQPGSGVYSHLGTFKVKGDRLGQLLQELRKRSGKRAKRMYISGNGILFSLLVPVSDLAPRIRAAFSHTAFSVSPEDEKELRTILGTHYDVLTDSLQSERVLLQDDVIKKIGEAFKNRMEESAYIRGIKTQV